MADERELAPEVGIRQALRFMTDQARTRVVALGPDQARQEAMIIASVRSQMGIEGKASLEPAEEEHAEELVTLAGRRTAPPPPIETEQEG